MFTQSGEFYDAIYSFKDYQAESAQIAALMQMRVVLNAAGFSAEFDEVGLTGRGLWTARLVA